MKKKKIRNKKKQQEFYLINIFSTGFFKKKQQDSGGLEDSCLDDCESFNVHLFKLNIFWRRSFTTCKTIKTVKKKTYKFIVLQKFY